MAPTKPLEPLLKPVGASETRVKVEVVSFSVSSVQQANLAKLLTSGVLDIKNGSFTCHLDGSGNIKAIDKHERLTV